MLKILTIIFAFSYIFLPVSVPVASAATGCLSFDLTVQRSDDDLRKLLAICDAESKETETQLNAQKAKSSTIASDVSLLDSLIKKAAQQIDIKNKIIKQLGGQITEKKKTIETLSTKLEREKQSLAQIVRKKNEIDNTSLTEMMLSRRRVSDFFLDVDNFETVNRSLQESMNEVRGIRKNTDDEKVRLEQQQLEQANLRNEIEADKKKTESQQKDKQVLLNESKTQEKSYADLLAQKKAQAAKISAALFKFKGNTGIPFGDAYRFAQEASKTTGVNTAFILAILKQESDFGKYDGGCILIDADKGTGQRVSTGEVIPNVMKPDRDLNPFKSIVTALGFDYREQQFSCPIKINGAYSGYGGAMGPSQFIPSTWNMYKAKLEAALKIPHANPWNPQHAIMATALFMKDLGAQNPAMEKDAACRYYSGRSCSDPAVKNVFYANSVLAIKAKIQADIDIIEAAR